MKTKSIMTLAAMALMMAACTSEDLTQPQTPNSKGIPFTATISGKAATRAITENTTDKVLVTSWAVNEQVALIHNDVVDVMKVSAIDDDGSATITGTITGSPKDGDDVQVVYPASAVDLTTKEVKADLLAEQDGTLATIASNLDLRMSEGAKLKVGPASATINGTVSLANQLAIVKFSLKEDADGTPALAAEKFEIADKSDNTIITVTPSTATSDLYVAMDPATTQTFHFIAKKGNEEYFYSQPSATLAAGKYYYQNMTLKDMLNTPLTLEATQDGTTITAKCGREIAFQYSINGGTKIDVYSESGGESFYIKLDKAGEFVEFYSKRYDVGEYRLHIFPDKETYIYGNVMSLIDDSGQGFANDKKVGDDALSYLFFNAEKLVFHPKKRIVLPATTLDSYCYDSMFSGCTGLTELPADLLPATTLAANCYCSMFKGCTGLTSLPEKLLPATTLATDCYQSMFSGCTGLETLPADLLPVTTLAMNCYKEMFHGCTGLTVAPDLPAPKLNEGCYSTMFFGCTKLSSVKCLATTDVFGTAFGTWLNGAGTAEGCERKLYVDPSMINYGNWQLDTSGEDGKRWTRVAITE